jgi:hypothetical protein
MESMGPNTIRLAVLLLLLPSLLLLLLPLLLFPLLSPLSPD